jgi:hypothetical protein
VLLRRLRNGAFRSAAANVVLGAAANPLRREWGLDGKFIVCYSGNMGRAHEFDTILGAAERLASKAVYSERLPGFQRSPDVLRF